jgi:16S rRNA processing protein RimM
VSADRLVAIGEVGRPHGVRGEVRVRPLTDHPERFEALAECVLWDAAHDRRQPCRIKGIRVHGDVLLVTVAGYDSPEAVAALTGWLLAVPESEAVPPPPGHFYPWQLVGCRVLTEDGRDVGRVLRIEGSPAQDLWVVGDEAREHLVPAVAEIVTEVDLAGRRVVIRPPEGLLNL